LFDIIWRENLKQIEDFIRVYWEYWYFQPFWSFLRLRGALWARSCGIVIIIPSSFWRNWCACILWRNLPKKIIADFENQTFFISCFVSTEGIAFASPRKFSKKGFKKDFLHIFLWYFSGGLKPVRFACL